MKASFSLSIPKPCSENWASFTPTSTGGFCGSCQKNVIDFTKATDDEIIAFMSRKPEHACGRFRNNQLKSYSLLTPVKIKPGFMLVKAGVVSLVLLLISKPAPAQIPVAKSTYQAASHPVLTAEVTPGSLIIKGIVKHQDAYPLPGISVIQKGTTNGTQTNENGEYEITLLQGASHILVFSFIGMTEQEITVSTLSGSKLNITMIEDPSQLVGELVITGEISADVPYTERTSGLKKLWTKIKNWF